MSGGAAPRGSVVMVSAGFWPVLGGAERQALELSRALMARGWTVKVLTRRVPGTGDRELVQGVPVRRLRVIGSGAVESFAFMVAAFGWLLKHGHSFDAFHAHLAGSPSVAAALAGRWLGRPVVVKLGGGPGIGEMAVSARSGLGRLKLRALASLKPRFTAVAAEVAAEARGLLGVSNIELLPNGVDTGRFRPVDAAERGRLRASLGWPAEGPLMLYCGRFSIEKRLPWLAKLFLWETRELKGARLVLVGDGPERAELEALEAGSGGRLLLQPAVEDPAPLYAAADAFALVSASEGLSNALLEAMSSGCAILASAVGGTPEAVEHEKSGLLFARDDEKPARELLGRLMKDAALRSRLGAGARERALSNFALDRVVERLERLYSGD